MQIKILGPGCKKCDQTAERVAVGILAVGYFFNAVWT